MDQLRLTLDLLSSSSTVTRRLVIRRHRVISPFQTPTITARQVFFIIIVYDAKRQLMKYKHTYKDKMNTNTIDT